AVSTPFLWLNTSLPWSWPGFIDSLTYSIYKNRDNGRKTPYVQLCWYRRNCEEKLSALWVMVVLAARLHGSLTPLACASWRCSVVPTTGIEGIRSRMWVTRKEPSPNVFLHPNNCTVC